MNTRTKRIGKSLYDVVRNNDGSWGIRETYENGIKCTTATAGHYRTTDDALAALATIDRERMIIGD